MHHPTPMNECAKHVVRYAPSFLPQHGIGCEAAYCFYAHCESEQRLYQARWLRVGRVGRLTRSGRPRILEFLTKDSPKPEKAVNLLYNSGCRLGREQKIQTSIPTFRILLCFNESWNVGVAVGFVEVTGGRGFDSHLRAVQ